MNLSFDNTSDINMATYHNTNSKGVGKTIIKDIENKLNTTKFSTTTVNSIKDNLKTLATDPNKFPDFYSLGKLSPPNVNYNTFKKSTTSCTSCSICFIIFVSILQIEDFDNQFDVIFELIREALYHLNIDINREINTETTPPTMEEEKDTIMKTYEGIFINENINGIMFNLLKEHPNYNVDSTNDLAKVYDENLNDQNDGSKPPNSLFKQHKLLKLDSTNITVLRNYIGEVILYGTQTNTTDNIDENNLLYKFIKDLDKKPYYTLNYWSHEIFYLEKLNTGLDSLRNRRPLIGNILEKYLIPAQANSKLVHCSDFTFLIVLANYLGHQKCNEQIRLLMDMKDFIEAVTSE
jgi:hypothetical protein